MKLLYELKGLVRLERDTAIRCYVAHWQSLCGEHYRKTCDALVADARVNGISAYISDTHAAKDVQTQADLTYAVEVVGALIKLGCRRFIVVAPQSSITRMATSRMGKVVDATGVSRQMVPTLNEALQLARGDVKD